MILIDGVPARHVEVSDRGFQYGDGVFETCAVRDRRIEYWPEHMARLQAGCERLGFLAPHADLLRAEAERALEASRGRAVLKIMITRGSGGRGYRPLRRPEPRRPAPHTPEAILGFDWDDVPVKVSIYPSAAERSPRRGQERARLAQVEALVAAAESTIAPHPSVP